jgi:hypothetical protein
LTPDESIVWRLTGSLREIDKWETYRSSLPIYRREYESQPFRTGNPSKLDRIDPILHLVVLLTARQSSFLVGKRKIRPEIERLVSEAYQELRQATADGLIKKTKHGYAFKELQKIWPSRKPGRPLAPEDNRRIDDMARIFLSEKRDEYYSNKRPSVDYLGVAVPPPLKDLKKGIKPKKYAKYAEEARRRAATEIEDVKDQFSKEKITQLQECYDSWFKKGRPRKV